MTYSNVTIRIQKEVKILKDRIRKIRKELDLTQQEFANKIGTTANVLTNYETGRRNPSASVINNICKTFNVSEAWLRTGEGDMFIELNRQAQIASLTKQLLDEEEDSFKNRLISVLANLTESQWETLAEIAEKLCKEKS